MKVIFRNHWHPTWGVQYYGGADVGNTNARFIWSESFEKAKIFDSLEEAQAEAKRFWPERKPQVSSWQDFIYVEVLDGNQTKILATPEAEGRDDSPEQATGRGEVPESASPD